jgi:hypothetical protein
MTVKLVYRPSSTSIGAPGAAKAAALPETAVEFYGVA